MATIDNYKIRIQVDGKDQVIDLNQSLDKLQTTITRTAQAGIAAFTALAASAVRMSDQMADVADSIGISVDKIYQLNIALEQAGGTFGEAGSLFKGFSNSLGDVAKGSEETINALTKLGLSQRDIEYLTDEQLFQEVVNGLGRMEAGFERNRLGMVLLGKAADGIDFKKLAEGTNQAADPALAANIKLAADAVGAMEQSFRSIQRAALEAIAPILQAISQLNFSVEDARKALQIFGTLIAAAFGAGAVLAIVKIVDAVKLLTLAIRAAGGAQAFLVGLSGVGLAAVAASAAAATAAYIALGKAMEGAGGAPTVMGPTGIPEKATPGDKKQRDQGVSAAEKAAKMAEESARQTTLQLIEQNKQANQYQKTIIGTIGYEGNLGQLIQANAQAEQDAANKQQELQKQIAAERIKGKDANAGVIAELQKQSIEIDNQLSKTKVLNAERFMALTKQREFSLELQRTTTIENRRVELDLIQKQIEGTTAVTIQEQTALKTLQIEAQEKQKLIALDAELKTAIEARDQTAIDNINRRKQDEISYYTTLRDLENKRMEQEIANRNNRDLGIKRAMESIERNFDPVKVAADQTTMLFDRMGQGLEEFVKTGKLNFKDFALSLIRDMLLIQIKAQAMSWLKGMMGGGGLFGGAIIPGLLAQGGPAAAGKPYIVGEKGPELFVPKSAGTVLPNDMVTGKKGIASGAVSAPVTNNYITNNVSAIDGQSVAQFFAQNRRLMLGSVEMARKEMPYGASR